MKNSHPPWSTKGAKYAKPASSRREELDVAAHSLPAGRHVSHKPRRPCAGVCGQGTPVKPTTQSKKRMKERTVTTTR